MLLHIGDISYANGDPAIWDTFMEEIEPYASVAPYMIGIGNHEYDYRTGREQHSHEGGSDASGEDQPYDPDWGNYGRCSMHHDGGIGHVSTSSASLTHGLT